MTCAVARRHELTDDTTRSEVYELLLQDLLGLPASGLGKPNKSRANAWLVPLQRLADARVRTGAWLDPIPVDDLQEFVASTGLQGGPDAVVELREKRVLIPADGDYGTYVWPHRSFVEYLAGSALARQLEQPNTWNAGRPQEPPVDPAAVWRLLDRKAWDPAWQEIIRFLAGALADPSDLLRQLQNPFRAPDGKRGDDVQRHGLALAGLCLGEIRQPVVEAHWEVVAGVASAALTVWLKHRITSLGEAVKPVYAALPFLTRRPPPRGGPAHFIAELRALLVDDAWRVREAASQALGALGPAVLATDPAHVGALRALLGDDHGDVREATSEALGALGPAVLTTHPAVAGALHAALSDDDWRVREAASEALGALGPAVLATDPAVVGALRTLLRDDDCWVRRAAIEALGALGPAVLTTDPAVVGDLGTLLDDDNGFNHLAASETLESIGRVRIFGSGGAEAAVWRAVDKPAFVGYTVAELSSDGTSSSPSSP